MYLYHHPDMSICAYPSFLIILIFSIVVVFGGLSLNCISLLLILGEHAVVHGTYALATVVDKRTYALFESIDDNSNNVIFEIDHDQMIEKYTWTYDELEIVRQNITRLRCVFLCILIDHFIVSLSN